MVAICAATDQDKQRVLMLDGQEIHRCALSSRIPTLEAEIDQADASIRALEAELRRRQQRPLRTI
jgi:hypothetical protein